MPMTYVHDIEKFCNTLLNTESVRDPYCKNGIQVPQCNSTLVQKIALAVTPSINVIEQAAKWNADLLLCHHGFLWGKGVRQLDITLTQRLQKMLASNVALMTYHIPLDAHAEIGNNALLAKELGLEKIEMSGISAVGQYSHQVYRDELEEMIVGVTSGAINFVAKFGPEVVRKVGICSGGGGDLMSDLMLQNIDTFVTGEISEQHWHLARELGINLIAAGHYHTEKIGIQALGKKVAKEFVVETKFFLEDCPV